MEGIDNEEDWEDLAPHSESAARLLVQLKKELSRGHELFRANMTVVARRFANDDILVAVRGRAGIAVVHLTWSQVRQKSPWPSTTWYESAMVAKAERY